MSRVVIVSGGSRGLGRAIVEAFLDSDGYVVSTFSRSRTAFIDELENSPELAGRFWFQSVDISDSPAIIKYVHGTRERFGSIDILINNAGVAIDNVLALQSEADVDRMINVNLKGTVVLTKMCVREMLPQWWGRIVNMSSLVGKTGYRGLSVYSLTKAGLNGFTRSLARELGDRGITVNSVSPGFLESEMTRGLSERQRQQIIRRTPVGRLGRSEDVVPLVLFLCSDAATFITGQTIIVDGGLTA